MSKNSLNRLLVVNRSIKIALQVVCDAILVLACFLFAMAIRLESFAFVESYKIWVVVIFSTIMAIVSLWYLSLYRTLVRFVTDKVIGAISGGAVVLAVTLLAINGLISAGIPRSVPIMTAAFTVLAIGSLRFLVRELFRGPMQISKRSVVIYGAGEAGLELLNSLFHARYYAPIAFIDDDPRLQGLVVGGCSVYPPSALPKIIENSSVATVLLAMPKIGPARRREVLSYLNTFGLEVKTIPSLSDIVSGRASITELRSVSPEELLGRDAIPPDAHLLGRNIVSKVVMVTGAGGSIGSELCRQIIDQAPKTLILYEMSEFALYAIEAELAEQIKRLDSKANTISILGSVQDEERLGQVIKAFGVQTIYHAAAYKHVPILEENIVDGIRNNVFGTLNAAKLANENGVEHFILVSTDKAVRPTNVMGATKRIAELICQALAELKTDTTFSMVRFGNVLGSSGSVIPRFKNQIEAGGPVTVTHPDITRYFMTIPEASQLVIQAGAMAKGGDVFVLDMGEPIKIADLAVTMIQLYGLKPYFIDGLQGAGGFNDGIAIEFTGLRKGEKLYEELLIGNDPMPTAHPRIMTASEVSMDLVALMTALEQLESACNCFDLPAVRKILKELPLDYLPVDNKIDDLTWLAQRASNLDGSA